MKQVEPMLLAVLRLAHRLDKHGQRADNRLNTSGRRFDRRWNHKD